LSLEPDRRPAKGCRLRRRPASRRRIDAPPVIGLVVRRSVRAGAHRMPGARQRHL